MKKKLKFEEAIRRLEEITSQLSDGTTLDESLKLYTEGAELIRQCNEQLEAAQLKIETLFPADLVKDDDGNELSAEDVHLDGGKGAGPVCQPAALQR